MVTEKTTLTKKDLAAIKKIFRQEARIVIKELKETQALNKELLQENKKMVERLNNIVLKMEKVNINEELIYETFLDAMVLLKLHNKKIRQIEDRLGFYTTG